MKTKDLFLYGFIFWFGILFGTIMWAIRLSNEKMRNELIFYMTKNMNYFDIFIIGDTFICLIFLGAYLYFNRKEKSQ